jgi:CRP-like cAMP-binding protein
MLVATRTQDEVQFPEGEFLFREGDPSNEVFLIHSGLVRVSSQAGGRERTVTTLGASELVGTLAALRGGVREESARCLLPTRCTVYAKDEFLGLLDGSPQLAFTLIQKLADRVAASSDVLRVLGEPDAHTRVSMMLLHHAKWGGQRIKSGFLVRTTSEELADDAEADDVLVAEAIHRYRRLHLVEVPNSDELVVTDTFRLGEYVNFLQSNRLSAHARSSSSVMRIFRPGGEP